MAAHIGETGRLQGSYYLQHSANAALLSPMQHLCCIFCLHCCILAAFLSLPMLHFCCIFCLCQCCTFAAFFVSANVALLLHFLSLPMLHFCCIFCLCQCCTFVAFFASANVALLLHFLSLPMLHICCCHNIIILFILHTGEKVCRKVSIFAILIERTHATDASWQQHGWKTTFCEDIYSPVKSTKNILEIPINFQLLKFIWGQIIPP